MLLLQVACLFCIFSGVISVPVDIEDIPPNINELNSFLASHEFVFVFFYGHPQICINCADSLKSYEELIAGFDLVDSGVIFAKIDGTTIQNELDDHDLMRFPMFRMYKNGKGYTFEGRFNQKGFRKFIASVLDPNFPPPNTVLTLTSANFSTIVDNAPLILVEFFAPWCGHCKRLAPDYEKAARELAKLETPIPLAAVDATVEKELAKQFDVKGYPTMKVFRRGTVLEYKGPRYTEGIVEYMTDLQKPVAKTITSLSELEIQENGFHPFILGLFNSENDPGMTTFLYATEYFRDKVDAFKTYSPEIINKYGGETGRILMVQPSVFHTKYAKPYVSHILDESKDTVESLQHFMHSNLFTFVSHYNRFLKQYYDDLKENKPFCLFFMDVTLDKDHIKNTMVWRNRIADAVAPYKDEMRFALADESEWGSLLRDFGLDDSGEEISVGCFYGPPGGSIKKYAMESMEDFDADFIHSFLNRLKEGKLTPRLKSAIAPVRYEGHFRPLVGSNIESIVFDDKTTTLIYFYSQTCPDCKKIYPSLESLASKLLSRHATKNLQFAKLDTTLNDYPSPPFNINTTPDFYLVIGGKMDNVIRFPGDNMNTEELRIFIQSQMPSISEEL